MPTTYAHKKFGALVYKNLSKDVKDIISENFECYLAGLHGPDVLFFHAPGYHGEVASIGRKAHKQSFEVMYRRAVKVLSGEQDEFVSNDAKLVYFIGCFCHYMLDSACHPFVAEAMNETGMSHGKVESELDRYILEKDGNRPIKYPTWAHLPVSMDVARSAADFYPGVSAEDFLMSLTTMKAVLMTCGIDNDNVRQVLCKVMEKTGNEKKIASLIMSRDKSMIVRRDVKKMYDRLVSEVDETVKFIEEFVIGYEDEFEEMKMPERFKMNFSGECIKQP